MPDQLQLRGGTTAQHASFTGASKEITVDTTKKTVVVHDGSTAGGNPVMREDGANSSLALGSASSPSLKWDANTGLYSPGADQLALATGGTGRLFVDANGNIGINTAPGSSSGFGAFFKIKTVSASPGFFVENGAADSWWGVYGGTGTTDSAAIIYPSTGSLRIATSTAVGVGGFSERMRLDSSGRLGLGTSVPSSKLSIAYGDAGLNGINIEANINGTGEGLRINGVTRTSADDATALLRVIDRINGDALRVNVNGRVGIGTTSPIDDLTVQAQQSSGGITVTRLSGTPRIKLYGNSASPAEILFGDAVSGSGSEQGRISYDNSTDALRFFANAGERARIDSSGRLLVGTSSSRGNFFNSGSGYSPLLQIEGTAAYATNQASALSVVHNSTDDWGATIYLGKSKSSSVGGNSLISNGDTIARLTFQGADGTEFVEAARIEAVIDGTPGANDMPGRLVFSTTADGAASPTERVRIASNGNFYIGGGTSFGGSGWTTQNSGCQVSQYSPTSDPRTLYELKSDNAGSNTTAVAIAANGTISARTTTIQAISSERRLKENIIPLNVDDAWETVKSVPFYSYNFIGADPSNVLYGPMADEVPDAMRVATSQSDDVGVINTYDNGMLQARLYVALQTALNKIETLEARLTAAGIE
jgi:hypothetical protein